MSSETRCKHGGRVESHSVYRCMGCGALGPLQPGPFRPFYEAREAELHDIITGLFALTDPEHDPELTARVHRVLGMEAEDGHCGNAVCAALAAAQARYITLMEGIQGLASKWRVEAAAKDSFHATMGVGWKACATDLEVLTVQVAKDGEAGCSESGHASDERKSK